MLRDFSNQANRMTSSQEFKKYYMTGECGCEIAADQEERSPNSRRFGPPQTPEPGFVVRAVCLGRYAMIACCQSCLHYIAAPWGE